MQLLLRQPAKTLWESNDVSEVAASPDSPGRERWQWDVRLERSAMVAQDSVSTHLMGAGLGEHFVNVRFDPQVIDAAIERRTVVASEVLVRDEAEIWVAIMEDGLMSEGAFVVVPGDVMVWEGDDPVRIPVETLGAAHSDMVLVRLWRRDGKVLRWVP